MYKLFLTFRYLTRKKIVLFPILVVWLCVMMLIIVTSIMGGFVERVRDANRELYGDIIISAGSSSQGFAGYDDLRHSLEKQFPEIQATTPVVEAYALIYAPGLQRSLPGLLVGVIPEERGKVSHYKESLFLQYKAPMEAVEDLQKRLPATEKELTEFALKNTDTAAKAEADAFDKLQDVIKVVRTEPDLLNHGKPNFLWLIGLAPLFLLVFFMIQRSRRHRDGWTLVRIGATVLLGLGLIATGTLWPVWFPRSYELAEDTHHQAELALNRAQRTAGYASNLPAGTYKTRDDLIKALIPDHIDFSVPAYETNNPDPRFAKPADGCIAGSQLMVRRDTRGNFLHPVVPRYPKVVITVFPPSKSGNISVSKENARSHAFTVVDDSHTGVYDVDSFNMYAPFELVQQLAGMRPDPELVKVDPTANFDPTCHSILIKLKPGYEDQLKVYRARIADAVEAYGKDHPDLLGVSTQTWDEKQAKYLGAVENEKVMMTFILLLMSGVVVIVIFLIFYQIVRDKTRDIGIIKAVGGSEEGVAGIFLTYGLFIGLVGGGLGVLTGTLFVQHTNEIHEWIYQISGIIIWDRSVYLFDRIPDKVYLHDLVTYFCIALGAGILGAAIPAVVAASEDPVKAIRYE